MYIPVPRYFLTQYQLRSLRCAKVFRRGSNIETASISCGFCISATITTLIA
jgi:hypothetical protein